MIDGINSLRNDEKVGAVSKPGLSDSGHEIRAAAYLGDAVFELCAREYLVKKGITDIALLNKEAKKLVSASAQAKLCKALIPALTDEEMGIYKKARNIGHSRSSKNADPVEYRIATGIEALFGELYLEGKIERINELFSILAGSADDI